MQRILDVNADIAQFAGSIIANTVRAKMRVPVDRFTIDVKEMLATIQGVPETRKFTVSVDHKYINYQIKSQDNYDMTDHELEEMQALDNAFTAEFTAKTHELVARLGASSSEFPVKHVDLYVTVYSYALLNSPPVLSVFVECT